MEPESGKTHIIWQRRSIQSSEDTANPFAVLKLQTPGIPRFKETLQAFVSKRFDHKM